METLHLTATRNTPLVAFRPEKGTFCVVGNSIPENAGTFYAPVVEWLQANAAELPDTCEFVFSLPYFNSSSLKAIYSILLEVKKGVESGRRFSVKWYVEEEDEFMIEAGETYRDMLGIPITLTPGTP